MNGLRMRGNARGRRMAMNTEAVEPVDHVRTSSTATLRDYVTLLRPTQWVKNVVVFAGPAAGLKLSSADSIIQALLAFVAFSLAASAAYCLNDTVDREADALHPTKRNRPIARGAIKPAAAILLAAGLITMGAGLSELALNRSVAIIVVLYFALTLAYSLTLKQRMILDVITIATGFVLRAWAGSMAVGVATSDWLVVCMFTLCMFMGFGKRRCELAMIGNVTEAGQHRKTLVRYTPQLLTHLITVSAGIAIMTFLLYTLERTHGSTPFHKEYLFYTLPIVVYAIFRFAMLTEIGAFSGPTEILYKDKGLLAAVVLWVTIAMLIVYQEAVFGTGGLAGLFSSVLGS